MGDSKFCPDCLWTHAPGAHSPVFKVQRADDMGSKFPSIEEVRAFDAEEAAERWAKDDDCHSAEYSIVSGSDAEVVVEDHAGNVTRWKVSGEGVPTYSAEEITP